MPPPDHLFNSIPDMIVPEGSFYSKHVSKLEEKIGGFMSCQQTSRFISLPQGKYTKGIKLILQYVSL